MIYVLSGPFGAGKTTLAGLVGIYRPDIHRPVSYTTRERKNGETNGVHYHFISREDFEKRLSRGMFVEYAEVGGHLYGTLKVDLNVGISEGDVLLEIDVDGMRQIKKRYSDAVTIFIHPPSLSVALARLKLRNRMESEDEVVERLHRAEAEVSAASEYDHEVVNGDLKPTVRQILELIDSARAGMP